MNGCICNSIVSVAQFYKNVVESVCVVGLEDDSRACRHDEDLEQILLPGIPGEPGYTHSKQQHMDYSIDLYWTLDIDQYKYHGVL